LVEWGGERRVDGDRVLEGRGVNQIKVKQRHLLILGG